MDYQFPFNPFTKYDNLWPSFILSVMGLLTFSGFLTLIYFTWTKSLSDLVDICTLVLLFRISMDLFIATSIDIIRVYIMNKPPLYQSSDLTSFYAASEYPIYQSSDKRGFGGQDNYF